MLKKVKVYPYAERTKPKPRGYITPKGKPWMAAAPYTMQYWELLADTINREPVQERDRFFMAMLKPLGIEKGKPFKPNERQKKLLTEAALVGEAMAKANDFDKRRLEDAHYVDGSQWEFATVSPPDQRREHYDALDGRAAWFYEAVTNDPAMHGQKTGKGQIYLAAKGRGWPLHGPCSASPTCCFLTKRPAISTRISSSRFKRISGPFLQSGRSSLWPIVCQPSGTLT